MARVMLADENSLVLDLMRIFLSDEGHDLELISSGAGLRDHDWAQVHDAALLVLSDSLEPGATSELIHEVRLKADQPKLPCLLTVAPGGHEEHGLAASLSHVYAIRKPFDRGSFLNLVRSIVDDTQSSGRDREPERLSEESPAAAVLREPPPEPTRVETDVAPTTVHTPVCGQEGLREELDRWFEDHGKALVEAEIRSFLQRGGEALIQKIVWQVVPELAEAMIRDEIKRITRDPGADSE